MKPIWSTVKDCSTYSNKLLIGPSLNWLIKLIVLAIEFPMATNPLQEKENNLSDLSEDVSSMSQRRQRGKKDAEKNNLQSQKSIENQKVL